MFSENDGVKIWYEIHGQGEPTLIMVPAFHIVNSNYFTMSYVPFLSSHMRVITLDLRGAGKSDKPDWGYDLDTYAQDLDAVVEAAGIEQFALAGYSLGAPIAVKYQALHPGKVSRLILLAGWGKPFMPPEALAEAMQSWAAQPEGMLTHLAEGICSNKHALRGRELILQWAAETTPQIWAAGFESQARADVDEDLKRVDIPALIIHGSEDMIIPPACSEYLHQSIPGSIWKIIPEADHGFSWTWPQVCCEILPFLKPAGDRGVALKQPGEKPKILWITSAIGLGHVKRDLVICAKMRENNPDLTVHWLTADPVRSFVAAHGEHIHPLSHAMWEETGHIEDSADAYYLDVFDSVWHMENILSNNFMKAAEAIWQDDYDLLVGDESWEVLFHLPHNLALKKAPFVFLTDFFGILTTSDIPVKKAHVDAINSMLIEAWETHPELIDLAVMIADEEDILDQPFGDGLPNIKEWCRERFIFTGYVLPFDPADYRDREALRNELGYKPDEKIILITVGGTSVGRPLIEKCLEAQAFLHESMPVRRTVVLCGPRLDPGSFGTWENVEFHPLFEDPANYYAACDLAVIQGGLSTSMELAALNVPFIYFPLKGHFEQHFWVDYRLKRHKAGVRMEYHQTSPADLARAMVEHINAPVEYLPIKTDAAQKAADMILKLI